MLSIVAWALAHCNVCIDPQKSKLTEKPAIILNLYLTAKLRGSSRYLVVVAYVPFWQIQLFTPWCERLRSNFTLVSPKLITYPMLTDQKRDL